MIKLSQVTQIIYGEQPVTELSYGEQSVWTSSRLPKQYKQCQYIQFSQNSNTLAYKYALRPWMDMDRIDLDMSQYGSTTNSTQNVLLVDGDGRSTWIGYSGRQKILFTTIADSSYPSACYMQPNYTGQALLTAQRAQFSLHFASTRNNVAEVAAFGGAFTKLTKWYSVKAYKNDELLLDWIPALRAIDSMPGFFDTVAQDFVPNTGPTQPNYKLK